MALGIPVKGYGHFLAEGLPIAFTLYIYFLSLLLDIYFHLTLDQTWEYISNRGPKKPPHWGG